MTTKALLFVAALALVGAPAMAEQTAGEKAEVVGNNAKRVAKKGGNRVKEAFCAEGDVKCAAKKAGNRVEEGADATKDKAKELKDKVD